MFQKMLRPEVLRGIKPDLNEQKGFERQLMP